MDSPQHPRERLIAAGANAVRERGGRPLPALAADEVVARAQVPKSTLYQLWSNFDDYRRDVLIELLRSSEPQDPSEIIDAVVPVLERGGHPNEVLCVASVTYFERFLAGDMFRWLIAAYPHREDAAVAPVVAEVLNGARDRFAQPLALLFAAARRRPRKGLDATQIAQLLIATYLGMAIRERLEPGVGRTTIEWTSVSGVTGHWPRIAVATEAIVSRCTEEV